MSAISLRACEIMQYLSFLPGFPNWETKLKSNLADHEDCIETWAFIVHDQDVKEDNTLKLPHLHLVLQFNQPLKDSTIAGYFGVEPQFVERIKQKRKAGRRYFADIGGALSYLTHRNAPDKHKYDDSQVVSKPGFDWIAVRTKSEKAQAENKNFQKVISEIESGKIRRFNLDNNISINEYIEHKLDFEKAFEYREERLKKDTSRHLNVIYITGASGTGKTTLAKKICNIRKLSYCISGSSHDPLQDYMGQDALILDELRPSVFSVSDMLKLLDNNTASAAGARYHDKWIEAQLIIITSILPIENFFEELKEHNGEEIKQLMRRCKSMIVLTSEAIEFYVYQNKIGNYVLNGSGANPVLELYKDTDVPSEQVKAECAALGITPISSNAPYKMEQEVRCCFK